MKAIIPTGGRGTRMQPLTFSTNKHFIPIANKPLIFYPIEAVAEAGIKDVLITYNPGWLESVKSVLGDGSKWNLKFRYVLQKKPLGLANIFQVCEEFLQGESFVLHLGDNIFANGIKSAVDYFVQKKPNALAVIVKVGRKRNQRMGVPYFDKNNRFIGYVEKPRNPPNEYGIAGLYLFDNNVFRCFRGKDKISADKRGKFEIVRSELEISLPYNWMLRKKYRVETFTYDGKWLDPGKFDDWLYANQYLLDNKVEDIQQSKVLGNSTLEGRVQIGKRSKILDTQIRGPVSIGDDVSIKNSYIGPYTSVSDGCFLENCHVENSVLMAGVVVKNIKQPINESLIGSGAEVLDENGPTDWLKLFIGEKSIVKI